MNLSIYCQILGCFFFIAYTFTCTILLCNIFTAIVLDCSMHVGNGQEQVSIGEFMQGRILLPMKRIFARYNAQFGDEHEARRDTLRIQEMLTKEMESAIAARQQEKEQLKRDVAALTKRRRKKQEGRIDLLMQSLMSLSRETNLISKRLRAAEDTDAPRGAEPDFFK